MSSPVGPPPPTKKPGKKDISVVRSLYDYTAANPDELSFKEGTVIYVLDKSDPNWLKCKIGDEEGLVPANYVGDNTAQIENPLHEASKRGNIPFLKELLSAGVSVHSLDRAKNTPLHWAARAGHPEAITLLLPHKPNLNAQNKLGDSPLHCAAWSGNRKCVELLLNAKGVDVTLRNADGALAVDIAKNDECAALLLQFTGTGVMDAGDLSDDDDD